MFEYKSLIINFIDLPDLQNDLNSLGKEGWELVNYSANVYNPQPGEILIDTSLFLIFKRRTDVNRTKMSKLRSNIRKAFFGKESL